MHVKKSTSVKILWLARILVGALFIFSGLIKMNDPLGFGYKLEEYFDVFSLGFLHPLATTLAVLLCAFEIILGVLLLFGAYAQKVTGGLLVLITFFTFLTFVSAAFKVVTSCGCFGDAIPLTPWQSFAKDLILLLLIIYIYRYRHQITSVFDKKSTRILRVVTTALAVGFGGYTINFLPVIDFLPYKIGSNIPAEMVIPKGEKPDEYQIIYQMKNKKTGEAKSIDDAAYLSSGIWEDEQWEIVGAPEKRLLRKGFKPKISDLKITDASGTDYTKELIENPNYSLVIVAYNLNKTNETAVAKLNALALNVTDEFNIRTVLLTSTAPSETETFIKKWKLFPEIFYADGVPLKSMVRANPGVLLLRNGIVINKWHHNNVPSFDKLSERYFRK